MRTRAQAQQWAQQQSRKPSKNWRGLCLQFVRSTYGINAKYHDAAQAWRHAQHKHQTPPPAGVPIWWTGNKWGHVALSAGGGNCWTTDYRRQGKVDLAPISAITRDWRLTYRGWSEDINGVRVWTPQAPSTHREYVIVGDGQVHVRGRANQTLADATNAAHFTPQDPIEYTITWRTI